MAEDGLVAASSSVFSYTVSLVLIGLLLFIAAANGAATFTSLLTIIFAVMIAARLWGRAAAASLRVRLGCDERRLFPGEVFAVRAGISNRSALPVRFGLVVMLPEAFSPLDADESPISPVPLGSEQRSFRTEASLLPFADHTLVLRARAGRRGVHRMRPATLYAGDPMGLCGAERNLPFDHEIVVFPRIRPVAQVSLPLLDFFGIHPSKGIVEDPARYNGTREYTGTRSAAHIHWKASARLEVLQEKIFEPSSHRKVFFLLVGDDFEAEADRDGFEAALEVVASLASAAAEAGASIAAATDRLVDGFPAVLPLGRGSEHLGSVLELLARCSFEGGRPLPSVLEDVATAASAFVVVARSPDERMARFYSLPAFRRERTFFLFAERSTQDERAEYPQAAFEEILS